MSMLSLIPIAIGLGAILFITIFIAVAFRTVVSTNDVHIVQSSSKTVSYGRDKPDGNTYYAWPSWVPRIGVKTIVLPVSVFSQELNAYSAYDKDRVPFLIDIMAFFRIVDSNVAAERIQNVRELTAQLEGILQGAVRTTLASYPIDQILQGRSQFGEHFTNEVDANLREWGVQTVKTIELMDIRDSQGSSVIANIMAKKQSEIEKESRVIVAENKREATQKEIEAKRDVDVAAQQAAQQVGVRTAEQEKEVGIAREQSLQEIKEQARVTAEKDMAVRRVQDVKQAEIAREVQVVRAEQERQTTILVAQGNLESTKLHATGVQAEGEARALAEKAMQLAPVEAQIVLAKEIGENAGYQKYLISIEQIKASVVVGSEQAKALQAADVKVISSAGNPASGVSSVMDLFTAAGGTQLGGMLEALSQSEVGREVIEAATGKKGRRKASSLIPERASEIDGE